MVVTIAAVRYERVMIGICLYHSSTACAILISFKLILIDQPTATNPSPIPAAKLENYKCRQNDKIQKNSSIKTRGLFSKLEFESENSFVDTDLSLHVFIEIQIVCMYR